MRALQPHMMRAGGSMGLGMARPTSVLADYVLHQVTQDYAAACTAAGYPATANRLNRHSRMMDRLDAVGIDYSDTTGFWVVGEQETTWLINLLNPGYDLVKSGSPVFTANKYFRQNTNAANYYTTPVYLSDLDFENMSMGVWANLEPYMAVTGYAGYQMGAFDGGRDVGINVAINTDTIARTRCGSATGFVPTTKLTGRGLTAINRTSSSGYTTSHYGVKAHDVTQALGTPVDLAHRIRLGATYGSTGTNNTPIAAAFIAKGMTDAQMLEFYAACEDFIRCVQYGDPFIYERNVGPEFIETDVVVYGLTPGAITAAYEAARRGRTVALVGDWHDETIWDLGGMPASGLWWVDIRDGTCWGGAGREALRWACARMYGITDDGNVDALSREPRAWNAAMRRMLDPSRTDTSQNSISFYLPGQDIKVYMTGGVASVTMSGEDIISIHTRDGRQFTGQQFIDMSYDADIVPIAGLPYVTGREAAGVGAIESYSGYNTATNKIKASSGVVNLSVDPYVTPATPASGLLYPLTEAPALSVGEADPEALQSMNYRITMSTSVNRSANWDTSPPPDYDESRYELLARAMAAATAASATFNWSDDLFNPRTPSAPYAITAIYDVNNGAAVVGTDRPGTGVEYMQAGLSPDGRRAVFTDLRNYLRGMIYWILNSGDSRITSDVLTTMQARYLDPLNHLDPGTDGVLFWPRHAYRRDATYRLQNADFVLTADDICATDGTTPDSVKTIACASYRLDSHAIRATVDGDGDAATLGTANLPTTEMGANFLAPIPLEAITPQSSVCSNLIVGFGASWTSLAHSAIRMEPTMCQIGHSAGAIADLAITAGVAVRNVDYTTLRADLLSEPYTRAMVLPQVM